jgi:L-histidine N-alpha-methyltransferase
MTAVANPVRNRLDILEVPCSSATSFADDVAAALGRNPKQPVPPKYFYDDLGSALFDVITRLPEYYLTRAETEILRVRGREIVREFGAPFELLELGSGSAIKTRLLIDEILRLQGTLRFNLIEISREVLQASSTALVDAYPSLLVRAYVGDYFDVLGSVALRSSPRLKLLALCMGSNIGNYHPADAQRLLALLSQTLRPGDGLLLGTDLKKDAVRLERAYHDPGGVMGAFSKNLLTRMNRELGANFDHRDFDLVARYDEERGSVDSFLRSRRSHDVTIPQGEMTLHFDEGEFVHTEWSVKFSVDDVVRLASQNGFKLSKTWYDDSRSFAVHLLIRERSIVEVSAYDVRQ